MSSWDASSIQIVWFSQQMPTSAAGDFFKKMFDAEPENIRNNRNPTPVAPFLSMASGSFGGGQGQVTMAPGRVDVAIAPPMSETGDVIHIKDTVEVLEKIVARGVELGPSVPEVYRLALVTTLLSPPVATLQEASALINERLGTVIPYDDAFDLQFQVNRRMTAKVDNAIVINRLLRFSVAVTQQFLIGSFTLGQPVPSGGPTSESIGASLAIDLNNVPTGNILEAETQKALWYEYLAETLRVRDDGGIGALV